MANEERGSLRDEDIVTTSVRAGVRPSSQRASAAMQDSDRGDADGTDTGDGTDKADRGDATDATDRGDTTDRADRGDADTTDRS
jgi:hypothetical protein